MHFPYGKVPQGEVFLEMCQMANIFILIMCWQVAARYSWARRGRGEPPPTKIPPFL